MAVPKRKTSKGRKNRRRSHHKVDPSGVVKCKSCGANKKAHTICAKCKKY